jgi:DNA-binding transcriptional regulator YhcF (GntR family)
MMVMVDRTRDEPVYGQIARQIRSHIAARHLQPGAALPGVRSLASELGVNLNTVARAYRQLEKEGFLRIRHRSGAEVTAPPRAVRDEDRGRMREELRHLLARLRQAGLSPQELHRMTREEIEDLSDGHRRQS